MRASRRTVAAWSNEAGGGPNMTAIADGTSRQLDPRFIPLERVVGQITTAIFSLVAAIVVLVVVVFAALSIAVDATMIGTWAVATAACVWIAHRWPEREYVRASYTVGEEVIEIRRGVWWRHVTKVPRSRVQHIDVAQGPLQRRYGLATLVIHTAGTEHARVELDGLAQETALALRDHLLPRESSDAV
jgi:membrane protein YdbS with pleckstrin-like domain